MIEFLHRACKWMTPASYCREGDLVAFVAATAAVCLILVMMALCVWPERRRPPEPLYRGLPYRRHVWVYQPSALKFCATCGENGRICACNQGECCHPILFERLRRLSEPQ